MGIFLKSESEGNGKKGELLDADVSGAEKSDIQKRKKGRQPALQAGLPATKAVLRCSAKERWRIIASRAPSASRARMASTMAE